ncbi:hypothetical protein [Lentzea sp. NPDC055074]
MRGRDAGDVGERVGVPGRPAELRHTPSQAGAGRGGLRAVISTESGTYGAIGAVLGLPLGVPFAWLAVATPATE